MNTFIILMNEGIGGLYLSYCIKATTKTRVIEWAKENIIAGSYTVYELSDYHNLEKGIEERAITI